MLYYLIIQTGKTVQFFGPLGIPMCATDYTVANAYRLIPADAKMSICNTSAENMRWNLMWRRYSSYM